MTVSRWKSTLSSLANVLIGLGASTLNPMIRATMYQSDSMKHSRRPLTSSCLCQGNIRLCEITDVTRDDPDFGLFIPNADQGALNGLDGAAHIALDDQSEFLDL
jgi:hypothetical protein